MKLCVKGQMQKERDSGMLGRVQKVGLKSCFVWIYWDALLFSTISAYIYIYIYVCSTCINARMPMYMQTGAVNVGLLHYWEGSLIPCTEGLCENDWLLASAFRSRCCGGGSQYHEPLAEEGERWGCGALRSSVLLQQWLAQLEGCSPLGIAIRTDAKNHMQATEARVKQGKQNAL